MVEVNIIKRKLQAETNKKIKYYQQKLSSIDTYLKITRTDEKQQVNEISNIKNKIKEKQKHYINIRRSLRNDLNAILLNNDLTFDLISDINFTYRIDKSLHCSKYLGVINLLLLLHLMHVSIIIKKNSLKQYHNNFSRKS